MWTVAAGVLGSTSLAACEARKPASVSDSPKLLVQHKNGPGVIDAGTGEWLLPPAVAAISVEQGIASVQRGGLAIWADGRLDSLPVKDIQGWSPHAVAGHRVAMIQGPPSAGAYHPASRSVTRLGLAGSARIYELPGNFEPEAFSPDGQRLYLLEYIPPNSPDLYRVRMLDLASGEIHPLNIKDKGPVPAGAEETMRGQGRRAVYDRRSGILFTLYTHSGDHQHTGQLLGVRPASPDVHSFIHALHLEQSWAVCIDLPAPFGTSNPEGHTLFFGTRELHVVSAAHGTMAVVDPKSLTIVDTKAIPKAVGEAAAVSTVDGSAFVACGQQLTDTQSAWTPGGDLYGLAAAKDGLLWTCADSSLMALDWKSKTVISRKTVAGLEFVHGIVAG